MPNAITKVAKLTLLICLLTMTAKLHVFGNPGIKKAVGSTSGYISQRTFAYLRDHIKHFSENYASNPVLLAIIVNPGGPCPKSSGPADHLLRT